MAARAAVAAVLLALACAGTPSHDPPPCPQWSEAAIDELEDIYALEGVVLERVDTGKTVVIETGDLHQVLDRMLRQCERPAPWWAPWR